MAEQQGRTVLPGSDRGAPLYGAEVIGDVPLTERFEVTIRVRRRAPLDLSPVNTSAPVHRLYLSREAYAENHGASDEDLAAVANFASSHGLTVVETSSSRRSVFVSGTAADFAKAFGTQICAFEHDGGTYRGRRGPLTVPSDVAPLIEGVFGIDDRPVAKPHFQPQTSPPTIGIAPHASTNVSYLPTEIAKLYNFPTDVHGDGQCIALIELGGGYRAADIKAYFKKLKIAAPNVVTVRVDGGKNQPSTANSADGEVMLDILVAGAVAPKARIAVYFAPNTDKGFLDALTMAVHDTANKPSVISISWGGAESTWTAQAMTSFDHTLQTAAALGVTVCAAAGDNGSGDAVTDGKAHVDFPASSPFMLACGGTKLLSSGSSISSETVWNESTDSATGGGISDFFPVPDYQKATAIPSSVNDATRKGRGVPDVAGDADPASGYEVRIDGQDSVIGGTSAVAPLWAGLIALINDKLGHNVGFLNPLIYAGGANQNIFRDITVGNNGAYSAQVGWDACTGWGSPNGNNLVSFLKSK